MDLDLGCFNYGADKPGPQARAELSWRLENSLSDYKIVVTSPAPDGTPSSNKKTSHDETKSPPKSEEVYHVHRSMLAVGPHNSLYFARLFLSKTELTEHASNTSSVELEPSAANAFPKMLDFIYSARKDKASNVTSQDAVPLRYLASYFGVEALFEEVNNFIRSDLKYTNAPIYVAEAMIYNDEKILDAASLLCAQNVTNIAPEVMAALPLKCFRDILLSPNLDGQRQQNSEIISRQIASFCRKHDGEVDKEVVLELTAEKVLPNIAHDEAFYMMSLSRAYSLPRESEEEGAGASLHERCISVLSTNWKSAIIPSIDDEGGALGGGTGYKSLPGETKVELLETVVKKIKEEVEFKLPCMDCGGFTCRGSDGMCSSCNRPSMNCYRCQKRFYDSYATRRCPRCYNYN